MVNRLGLEGYERSCGGAERLEIRNFEGEDDDEDERANFLKIVPENEGSTSFLTRGAPMGPATRGVDA